MVRSPFSFAAMLAALLLAASLTAPAAADVTYWKKSTAQTRLSNILPYLCNTTIHAQFGLSQFCSSPYFVNVTQTILAGSSPSTLLVPSNAVLNATRAKFNLTAPSVHSTARFSFSQVYMNQTLSQNAYRAFSSNNSTNATWVAYDTVPRGAKVAYPLTMTRNATTLSPANVTTRISHLVCNANNDRARSERLRLFPG